MSAAEFKQVYDETTPKLMYAAAQRSVDGELPSGVPSGSPVAGSAAAQRSADTSKSRLPPRYVPFDLSVFDKEPEGEDDARSTEVGSEPSWESASDSEVDGERTRGLFFQIEPRGLNTPQTCRCDTNSTGQDNSS